MLSASWRTTHRAAAYERLKASPNEFRCFDAAQIVKHYLGLKSVFPKRPITLLYLYWEPVDQNQHRLFAQHRAEIASFSEHLADADVGFASLTYTELWRAWAEQTHPNWLPRHVELLTKRYLVSAS